MNFVERIFEHLSSEPAPVVEVRGQYRPEYTIIRNGVSVVEMHGEVEKPVARAALLDDVARARHVLRTYNVKKGDRVALYANNSARWIAADLACLAEGLVVVPLYARQAVSELAAMVKDAGCALALVENDALGAPLAAEVEGLAMLAFDALFSGEAPSHEPPVSLSPNDLVTLVYTSGTSGVAKGVKITVANVDSMLPVTTDALARMMGPHVHVNEHRLFHYLPFCFMGSRIVLWTSLFRGGSIWVSTKLEDLVNEMRGAKPHYFLNVPALLERIKRGVEGKLAERPKPIVALYESAKRAYFAVDSSKVKLVDQVALAVAKRVVFPKVRAQLGPNLKCLLCGSAPLHPDTQRWFEMLGLPVYQVYGLTETTAIVTMDVPPDAKAGHVGKTISICETKLGENDELLVRGPNMFAGYWNRDDATAEALKDGWFHTGDQVEWDADGRLKVIGRANAVLVLESGHNVAPEPIESHLLAELDGKAEHVVAIGHGRPGLSLIVTGPVESAGVQKAIDALNETLPHYKRIRRFHKAAISLTPENELLTANQKLKRRAIEKHFAKEIEEMYR